MGPLGPCPGALHGTALVRTELAGRFDAESAGPAKPGAAGDCSDAVTSLEFNRSELLAIQHLGLISPGGHRYCIYRRKPFRWTPQNQAGSSRV